MSVPLESFIKEWELRGKNKVSALAARDCIRGFMVFLLTSPNHSISMHSQVSVFIPVDIMHYHTFSAYVVMIRNDPFGRRVVQNWLKFADGLCEKGNFASVPGRYGWGDSDQPGIWWALAKTYSELYHPEDPFEVPCNETTGVLTTPRFNGPEMRNYFIKYKVGFGYQGKRLNRLADGK